MRKLLFAVGACAAAAVTMALAASAADFTLHGGAQAEAGDVKLVSDLSNATMTDDSSWIDFSIPASLRFSELSTLSTQFDATHGSCGGGSPRFQLNVDGKNVFVYLGPSPSFTGCTPNTWLSSGNLVGTSDQCRVDTSQLASGTQCTTWAAADALLGSHKVTGIQLVVDSGWFFGDKMQTILVRNVTINGRTFIRLQTPSKQNPAKLCAAQRMSMGASAFNAFWGRNANDRNAFGKCASAMTRAVANGNATSVQATILHATASCKARGLHRGRLAACVARHTKKGRKH